MQIAGTTGDANVATGMMTTATQGQDVIQVNQRFRNSGAAQITAAAIPCNNGATLDGLLGEWKETKLSSSHSVTSDIGYFVVRLVQPFVRLFGPLSFYHSSSTDEPATYLGGVPSAVLQ